MGDKGGGGHQKYQKMGDVIYGRPLITKVISSFGRK